MADAGIINAAAAEAVQRRGLGFARPPHPVADGITWGYMYFGGAGYKADRSGGVVGVADPATTGWATAFVLDDGEPMVTVFYLWTMQSWRVPRDSYEMDSFRDVPAYFMGFPQEAYAERFRRYYAEHRRRGSTEADYATCVRIMGAMGVPVPTEEELGDVKPIERPQATGGKAPPPPKRDGSSFKPVKRSGRRGEVLQFFLEGGTSAAAATKQFGITRSNLLSQLYLLNKEHGIGYTVKGDDVAVQLPEGVEDPFK